MTDDPGNRDHGIVGGPSRRRRARFFGGLTMAALASIVGPADAATGTSGATINASVSSSCNFGVTATLAFGNLPVAVSGTTDKPATSDISVSCSNGAAYTIYLGDGDSRDSAGAGLRGLKSGVNRVAYQLYKDSANSIVWDETGGVAAQGGSGGVALTGNGAEQLSRVYGLIRSAAIVPALPGTYADTVRITVTY